MLVLLTILAAALSIPPSKGLWSEDLNISVGVSVADYTCPRSKGFWQHQFSAALGIQGSGFFSLSELDDMLLAINGSSQIFSFDQPSIYDRAAEALAVLKPPYADMEEKVEAQLLALWLNHVSGYADGYEISYDGTVYDASSLIAAVEDALVNGDQDNYVYWKDAAETFNTSFDCGP
ncbi:transcriptional regulator [Aeropyrum camini SY1 = JCM 12091]|uniref:Transcriptional regulator n=1 Tax=Aeropyrum camini SY1 = JCM 12091 TaxID=1198449 RepID=U3THZ5_9CREN|nr:transcriptional regulator [Aeropyrum camini SY1 = JCM 12091]